MKVTLENGVTIPALGLGTWQIQSKAADAVKTALEVGYRHIDTASIYKNERGVGEGVRKSGVERSEIFVTSKLWDNEHGYDQAKAAFRASLRRLGFDYLDLYLIHWPQQDGKRLETWQALGELYDSGVCRAVGVSNYNIQQLEDILNGGSIRPMVNQIELHPYNYREQRNVVEFCQKEGIVLTAYSPLTKGKHLNAAALKEIASAYDKSTAQVLIRWALQHDFTVIPKSDDPDHIRANINVFDFELSDEHMRQLDSISAT